MIGPVLPSSEPLLGVFYVVGALKMAMIGFALVLLESLLLVPYLWLFLAMGINPPRESPTGS